MSLADRLRANLNCCSWWQAPFCWLDNLCGCRFRWVCNLHDLSGKVARKKST